MVQEFQPQKMKPALRKGLLWILVTIGVILFLVFALTRLFEPQQEARSLLNAVEWGWVLIGWILMCSALLALGFRWRALLTNNEEISGTYMGSSLCSGLLLNYAIPGPFGELASAWFVHRRYEVPMGRSFATGLVARLIGLCTAAAAVIVFGMLIELNLGNLEYFFHFSLMCGGLGLVSIMALILFPQKWIPTFERLEKRRPNRFFVALLSFLKSFAELGTLPMRAYLSAISWSLIGHLLAYLGILISLWGIVGDVSLAGVAFAYAAGTCLGAVAFLFPGSQLGWDALFAGLLVMAVGLDPLTAGVAALVLRIEQLLMMALGAIFLPILYSSIKARNEK